MNDELEAAVRVAEMLGAFSFERVTEVGEALCKMKPAHCQHILGVLVQRGQDDVPKLTLAELCDPAAPFNPGGGAHCWRVITGQETGYLGSRTYGPFEMCRAAARSVLRERLRRDLLATE